MDRKYWAWPNLQVPEAFGALNDARRYRWPLERVTRTHAQLACVTLDIHYKNLRASEETASDQQ
eukprot:12037411-Alexandrium_andersonii.AAC.1